MAGGTATSITGWENQFILYYNANSITVPSATLTNAATYTFGGTSGTTVTAATSWYNWNNARVGYIQQAQWAQWQGGIVSAKTKKQAAREQAAFQAAFQRQEREHQERMAREQEERRKAQARARALLMTNLSPAQRKTLEMLQYFDIEISGKTYRIHQGTHGNVRQVEQGREVVTFCAQPDGVPAEDAMLAQKLMLETDEAAFLRVANARRLY